MTICDPRIFARCGRRKGVLGLIGGQLVGDHSDPPRPIGGDGDAAPGPHHHLDAAAPPPTSAREPQIARKWPHSTTCCGLPDRRNKPNPRAVVCRRDRASSNATRTAGFHRRRAWTERSDEATARLFFAL